MADYGSYLRYFWSFAFLLALTLGEYLVYRFYLKRSFPWKAAGVSIVLFAIWRITAVFYFFYLPIKLVQNFYPWRLFDLPVDAWWYFPLLVLLYDFFYYWHHRFTHEIRFFWASHHIHHSAEELTVVTSSRFTPLPLDGFSLLFFVPLYFVGFHPLHLLLYPMIHTTILLWVHVDWIPRLAPIEGFLNTPAAHRVHHARQAEYLNKNYGGIFVFWDKLFGTYQAELPGRVPEIGPVVPVNSFNPLVIAFFEWRAMLVDFWRAPDWKRRWRVLAWRPGADINS